MDDFDPITIEEYRKVKKELQQHIDAGHLRADTQRLFEKEIERIDEILERTS